MNTDLLPRTGRILCAVSGGIDSMCLLVWLHEQGYGVTAAHYNHGLRGRESQRDEDFVRDFCRSRAIPFVSERGDVAAYARQRRQSVELAARGLRYEFLERAADKTGAQVIATAHTADDNVETILFNMARGTGLSGLTGIPPTRGRIVRPMLGVTRAQAEAYLNQRHILHVEDASNGGDDYTRNRLRHHVVPVLARENPSLPETVGRMAELLRRDEAYLSAQTQEFLARSGTENGVLAEPLLVQPWPIASRAVRQLAGRELTMAHVEAILSVAETGGVTDVAGMRVGRAGDRLVFSLQEREPLPLRALEIGQTIRLPEAGLWVKSQKLAKYPALVHKSFNIFYFKYENIYGNIIIGPRRPGDSYRPVGRGCTKTLKQLMLEKQIPSWERQAVPVLRDQAGILGVYGFGAAERAAAGPEDTNILKIEFVRDDRDEEGCSHE
jgi:tRNA(Ile)-lysidine synthase